MWTYETTRAASQQTTSSFGSTTGNTIDGKQTITADGLEQTVGETNRATVHHSVSMYGVGNISHNAVSAGTTATYFRDYSGPGEDELHTRIDNGTTHETYDGIAGTISVLITQTNSEAFGSDASGTTTNSTTLSGTGSFPVGTESYNYTTTSTGETVTYSRTTTATRTESFYTGTTNTDSSATTETTSRSATYNTSTTSTRTTSSVTYLSTSNSVLAYRDTVVVADWSDWLWRVTGTGSKIASDVAFSFTRTTISESYDYSSVSVMTIATSVGGSITPFDSWNYVTYDTQTSVTTQTTFTSSSYSTQATVSSGADISLSTTSSASVQTTSTVSVTLLFNSAVTTTTNGIFGYPTTFIDLGFSPPWGTAASTDTYSTTAAGGVTTTTSTQSVWSYINSQRYLLNYTTSYDDSGTDDHYSNTQGVGFSAGNTGITISEHLNYGQSYAPATISYKEPNIGSGFQDPDSVGYAENYGTGFLNGFSLIGKWALGFPGLYTPIMDTATVATTYGGVPMTVQYDRTARALYTTTSTTNFTGGRVDATGSFSFSLQGSRDTSATRVNTQGGHTIGGYGYETATSRFTTMTLNTLTYTSTEGTFDTTYTSFSNTYTTTEERGPGITITVTSGDEYTTSETLTTATAGVTTARPGIHRVSSQDSTGGSTSYYESWTNTARTSSVSRSDWLALESAAALYSSTDGSSPVVSFSAYSGA